MVFSLIYHHQTDIVKKIMKYCTFQQWRVTHEKKNKGKKHLYATLPPTIMKIALAIEKHNYATIHHYQVLTFFLSALISIWL